MTAIEWTHMPGYRGETWNPVTGCTKVSAGCKYCYAERNFPRPYARTGRKFTDIATYPERLDRPLRATKPRCYFVNSMSDLFHEDVPDEFIDQVFAVMALSPQHRFLILTKRPERMRAYLSFTTGAGNVLTRVIRAAQQIQMPRGRHKPGGPSWPYRNVYLGVSVEDQATADERIPLLLDTPAAVRFVSYEPALGPVDLGPWIFDAATDMAMRGDPLAAALMRQSVEDGSGWMAPTLDWIIVGGESGPKARPFDVQWARSTRDQCRAAGVAFFMKQMSGTRKSAMPPIPDDLMIREFPNAL